MQPMIQTDGSGLTCQRMLSHDTSAAHKSFAAVAVHCHASDGTLPLAAVSDDGAGNRTSTRSRYIFPDSTSFQVLPRPVNRAAFAGCNRMRRPCEKASVVVLTVIVWYLPRSCCSQRIRERRSYDARCESHRERRRSFLPALVVAQAHHALGAVIGLLRDQVLRISGTAYKCFRRSITTVFPAAPRRTASRRRAVFGRL